MHEGLSPFIHDRQHVTRFGYTGTRIARGHTGLPLQTGGLENAAFLLVQSGAIVCVFGPLLMPGWYLQTIMVSGALWTTAFALFTLKFCLTLIRPRIVGRSG